MITLIRDFNTVAFQFARKLSPKLGYNYATDYARHMCVLWAFLLLMLLLEIITAALHKPGAAFIGRNPLVHIIGVIVLLFLGNALFKRILNRIPELRTGEETERHYKTLSQYRKIFVVTAAIGTLIIFLGIIATRQFLGLFGGFQK